MKGSTLVLAAFATAFFPRLLSSMGFPAPINFVHFAVVPLVCVLALTQTRVKNRQQIAIANALLIGLLLLLTVMIASAILNGAGIVNVVLDFVLLTEPIILLLAIMSVPLSIKGVQRFRAWILGFGFTHLTLALLQALLLRVGIMSQPNSLTIEDNIQGVFYISYGGHVVGATVSMCFCLYYLVSAKTVPLWIRVSVCFAGFVQIILADAKQVILVAIVAWVLLILSRVKNIGLTLQYLIVAIVLLSAFWWCVDNLELFAAYKTWIRPEIYGPDGDATVLKSGPLRMIPTYYESVLNWFIGLGPGHTIGRLGGWMIKDYSDLLDPLGATTHPVTEVIWATWRGYYLDSSMFSPFWGLAAIWGDLGFLGLAAYLSLWLVVYQRLCPDDFSRFITFNVIVNGFVFTLLEEPGFMLTVAVLIGLQWQERQLKRQQQQERQAAYYMALKSFE
ncbi:MAG: hypothetical protein RBJ76_04670 [Stenomitos frigidus ULC029]